MKIIILYHPISDTARTVEEYVRDFKLRNPEAAIELKSLETREGVVTASLYDVVAYPAFLVVDNEGKLARAWSTDTPLMDELAGYIHHQ